MRLKSILLPVLALLLLTATASAAACACGNVAASCTMNASLSCTGANAITVTAPGVTINCQGNNLTSTNANSRGIYSNQTGTKVQNCRISNVQYGIEFSGALYAEVTDTAITSVSQTGMLLSSTNYSNFTNVVIRGTLDTDGDTGISLPGSSNNVFLRCNAISGATGVSMPNSSYNTFLDSSFKLHVSWASNNTHAVMLSTGSAYNLFRNNSIIATNNAGMSNDALYSSAGVFNTFCLNRFDSQGTYYITDLNPVVANAYNCTYGGINQGNIYPNVESGAIPVTGSAPSSVPGYNIGSAGSGYPVSDEVYTGHTPNNKLHSFYGVTDSYPLIPSSLNYSAAQISPVFYPRFFPTASYSPYYPGDLFGYCLAPSMSGQAPSYEFKWYKNGVETYNGTALKGDSLEHGCAIVSGTGQAKCWGANDYGRLGVGDTTMRSSPTAINDSSAYSSIATASYHSCGILASSGRVTCWGYNNRGQLGNGDTTNRLSPTFTSDTSAYSAISVGDYHSCGIRANDSRVLCWGRGDNGQLGTGGSSQYNNPTLTSDVSAYSAISAKGYGSCGILADTGQVKCWGINTEGQLGTETPGTMNRDPAYIGDLSAFSSISIGTNHGCAIRANDSRVLCWGANGWGQLGRGFIDDSVPPFYRGVPALTTDTSAYSAISTTGVTTCGIIASTGRVKCWGYNSDGSIGAGYTSAGVSNPTHTSDTSAYSDVSGTCGVVASTGQIKCWGPNGLGYVGDGTTTTPRTSPTPVNDASTYGTVLGNDYAGGIAGGQASICAIRTSDKQLMCWGFNGNGQLGVGDTTDRYSPTAVTVSAAYSQVALGYNSGCAIRADNGQVYCWGLNSYGQLGTGTYGNQYNSPTAMTDTSAFSQVSIGNTHSCGIKASDSRVYCWGLYNQNTNGALGDGTSTGRLSPTAIYGSDTYKAVGAGEYYSCGLRTDGRILCWGAQYAALNNPVGSNYYPSLSASDTSTYTALSVGRYHVCAIRASDGRVACWGKNEFGQLGSLPLTLCGTTDRNAWNVSCIYAVPINDSSPYISVSVSDAHSCGVRADGQVRCWGQNTYAQLGNGGTTDSSTPVSISDSSQYVSVTATNTGSCAIRADGQVRCWGRGSQIGNGVVPSSGNNWNTQSVPVSANDASPYGAALSFAGRQGLGNASLTQGDVWSYSCRIANGSYLGAWKNSTQVAIPHTSAVTDTSYDASSGVRSGGGYDADVFTSKWLSRLSSVALFSDNGGTSATRARLFEGGCSGTEVASTAISGNAAAFDNVLKPNTQYCVMYDNYGSSFGNRQKLSSFTYPVSRLNVNFDRAGTGYQYTTLSTKSFTTQAGTIFATARITPAAYVGVPLTQDLVGYCTGATLTSSITSFNYKWEKNGALFSSSTASAGYTSYVEAQLSTVPSASLTSGETWTFSCQAVGADGTSAWHSKSVVVCSGCYIGGSCYASGYVASTCANCTPSLNAYGWSNRDGVVCRASAGACDYSEYCSGTACPGDSFVAAGTSVSGCNAYTCSGGQSINRYACNGGGSCTLQSTGTTCTNTCNYCSEGSGSCAPYGTGTQCRASTGDCDPPDYCNGAGSCSSDAKCGVNQHVSGTSCVAGACRPGVDTCDAAEQCDGAISTCPATDSKVAVDTLCSGSTTWSASNGACTATRTYSTCDGTNNACPDSRPGYQTQNASVAGQVWWSGAWTTASCSYYCSASGSNACLGQQPVQSVYGCSTAGACNVLASSSCSTVGACAGTIASCGCSSGTCTTCSAPSACTTATCTGNACGYTINSGSCYIGGTCYSNGAVNGGNACQVCNTAVSTTAWSNRDGYACAAGDTCATAGYCSGGSCPGVSLVAAGTLCFGSTTWSASNGACTATRTYNTCNGVNTYCPANNPGAQTYYPESNGQIWMNGAWASASCSQYCSMTGANGCSGQQTTTTAYGCSTGGSCNVGVTACGTGTYCAGTDSNCGCSGGSCTNCAASGYICSSYSCVVPVVTPTTPTLAVATDQPLISQLGKIAISWGANGNTAGTTYEVQETTVGTTLSAGESTSYTHSGISDNTRYCYRVRAYHYAYSGYSATVCAITADRTAPASPYLLPGKRGLVGYWKFDEGSGSYAYDSAGSNTGTLTSGPTWTTSGRVNSAALFDGVNDYINVPDSTSLNFSTGPFTAYGWFKSKFQTGAGFISKGASFNSNAGWSMSYASSPQALYLLVGNGTAHIEYYTGLSDISDWRMVGIMRDASNKIYYINNGVLTDTGSVLPGNVNSAVPLKLGKSDYNGATINGSIDEVKVFNRALSAAEVSEEYIQTKAYVSTAEGDSGLVLYMPFEEASGTATADWSKNTNDGALYNSPAWTTGKEGTGSALSFTGTNYVIVPDTASLNPAQITVEAWINPTGTGNQGIARKNPDSALSIYNGKIQGAVAANWAFYDSGFAPTANTWQHVAMTYDGSALKFYKDGVAGNSHSIAGSANNALANALRIGYDDNGWYFNGKIDEVRIYNRSLSQREIINDMQGGRLNKSFYRSTSVGGPYSLAFAGNAPNYADTATSDTVAPATPSAPTVAAASTTAATVSWGQVTDYGNMYYYYASSIDGPGNNASSAVKNLTVASGTKEYYVTGTGTGASAWYTGSSASISGLTPNTQYCYTITPRDHALNSGAASASGCAWTPPTVPSTLSVSAVADQALNSHLGKTSISWAANGNPGGTTYELYKTSPATAGTVYTGTTASYTHSGLADNTQYCYQVRATGSGGQSSWLGGPNCATTIDRSAPTPDPATVASVTANSYSQITVVATSATEPHSAPAQYNISRVSPTYASSGWQAGATWVDTGLTGTTNYCYKVQYKDNLGNIGTLSSQSCATTPNAPPTCSASCTPSGVYTCASPCTADVVSCSMQGSDTESSSLTYTFETKMNGVTTTGGTSSGSLANGGWVYFGGRPYISPVQTGTFTIVFNVTDGNGAKTSCTSNTVSVTSRPNAPPAVTAKYITPSPLTPNQGLQLHAVATDNDGYVELVNYGYILKYNGNPYAEGSATGKTSNTDTVLIRIPEDIGSLPLQNGHTYSCTVWAYDGISSTYANATRVECPVYTVTTNTAPTLASISLAPACIKTGSVSVSTSGFGDANGDTTYLQAGTSSGGTNICNVASSSCSFTAQSFYGGTGANAVWARAYDGMAYSSPVVSSSFSTDNSAPGTTPFMNTTPVGINRCDLTSSVATDAGCNGTVKYLFTRAGTAVNSGWISSNTWSDTSLSAHTTYNYTVQYKDGFDNAGSTSGSYTCLTGNSVPALTSISVSPACIKTGTVTVTANGATDANSDALTLQAGAATGQSNLCTGAGTPPSCTFLAQSFWNDTAVHTVYGRVADGYAGGTSGEVNSASAFQTDNSGPATVANITSATPVGTSQINVAAPLVGAISDTGCALMGATPYNFTRIGGPSSGWQAGNTWSATGLSAHTQYCFTVRYQDAFGNAGAASAQACANTSNTAPPAPSNIAPNGGQSFGALAANAISISWSASSDPDGDAVTYAVEYSANSGSSWSAIGSTASTSYAWDSTAIPSLPTYRVRVRASDAYGGVSGYAASASDFAIVHNTAPTIADIQLAPTVAYTSDSLNCSIRPLDGQQLLLNASVEWYKNNVLVPALSSSYAGAPNNTLTNVATLGAGNLSAGETWHCKVNVTDSMASSSWAASTPTSAVLQGCGVLSSAGAVYSLGSSLSAPSTCFNVTGGNIEINCNGRAIAGANASGVYGVFSSASGTKVHNCTFVDFANAIHLEGASLGLFYNNTFSSATGTHVNVSAASGSNRFYLNSFGETSGAYVRDLNGGNYYNTSLSGHGEGNAYANVIDGSVLVVGATQSSGMAGYNVGSSGPGYPYRNSTSLGKFVCSFANCADYAPIINRILATYTCRISPDAPFVTDTLQGWAGSPGSLGSNVTYYYRWYMNGSLNCTSDEASVQVR